MHRTIHNQPILIAALLLCISGLARADADLSGSYGDAKLSLEIHAGNGAYTGFIHKGQSDFPVKATATGTHLTGSFQNKGFDYPFSAILDGQTLHLFSGGKEYPLAKQIPPNPLAADTPIDAGNNAAPPATPTDAPAGYTIINSPAYGRALLVTKPHLANVTAVLQSVFPDLAAYFHNRPQLVDAYEDAHDHRGGGATFTGSWNNQPIHGLVSVKITDQGATVSVVFARTDASADQFKQLSTTPPASAQPAPQAAPQFQLTEYDFPDNTGSISLADGWKTQAQSLLDPIAITGPADQSIQMNGTFRLNTTHSPFMQIYQRTLDLYKQNKANYARMGMNPPLVPPKSPQDSGAIVLDYCTPPDAIRGILTQICDFTRAHGGANYEFSDITEITKLPKTDLGGDSSIVSWSSTLHAPDGDKHYKIYATVVCLPPRNGFWIVSDTQVRSPESSFDQDKPLMLAMVNSVKKNDVVVNQLLQQRLQAIAQNGQRELDIITQSGQKTLEIQRQGFQDYAASQNRIYQNQHNAQMQQYADRNAQEAQRQNRQQRASADFTEAILGQREIYDTQTGQSADVNLFYSHAIVNELNQNDPGHYVEIPLRDKLYPQQ